ncbi:MAG: hypothetical protein MJ072_04710, partial [Clostridia bacterium]|nr:hypothetical protein [Clostridia bacterium]
MTTVYTINNAYEYLTGKHTITAALIEGNENFTWPGNAQAIILGEWEIVRTEVEAPEFIVPNVPYSGNPYDESLISLDGSWKWVNTAGENAEYVFNQDYEVKYEFYYKGTPISAPTEVGLYTVKVNLQGACKDPGYTFENYTLETTFQITKAAISLENPGEDVRPYSGNIEYLPIPVFRDADGNVDEATVKDGKVYFGSGKNEKEIALRYYVAVKTEILDAESQPTGEYDYNIAEKDEGSLINYISGDIGTYYYFVEIDSENSSYSSVGTLLVTLTIEPSAQNIIIEKNENVEVKANVKKYFEIFKDGDDLGIRLTDKPENVFTWDSD